MTKPAATTDPVDQFAPQTAPRLTIAPSYTDPRTGAVYVHQDLVKTLDDWSAEAHVSPIKAAEQFGDIESWVGYVQRFSGIDNHGPLLTWNETRLRAILDYHTQEGEPGRVQWTAEHPFSKTPQWTRWSRMADGHAKSQQDVLEFFEDNAPDVKTPTASMLASLLRTLRATVNTSGETTLAEDGSTAISYAKTASVKTNGDLTIPPSFTIGIPILKGHMGTNAEGKTAPVVYELEVKLRVSVGGDSRPHFRLTIPQAEQALEKVYADRVAAARDLLTDAFTLLRAAP
jgi:uncharacterized protein YfdQ (DUF2303 family)